MRPITQSRMRRRRWLPAAFCLLCCLLFSGCTPGATVDSLLKPPSLSEEQQQIYLALQDAVGSGITLQYPRAGANLSAFTVVDLDGDGEDEALVFYKKTNLAAVENGLRLSVLDQVKGKWMSVCDRPADGTEVERIVVSAMGDETQNQIFVGYSGVDQSDKSLTVYRYGDSQVEQLFTAAYTMFDVADLDGDQAQELLVLGKLTENASSSAAMYRLQDGSIKDNGKLDLRTGFTDFSQVLYGTLSDGTTGIYIDGATGPSSLQTEILHVQSDTLAYVLADGDTVAKTNRSVGYLEQTTGEVKSDEKNGVHVFFDNPVATFIPYDLIRSYDRPLIMGDFTARMADPNVKSELDWQLYLLQRRYLDYQVNIGNKMIELLSGDDEQRKLAPDLSVPKRKFQDMVDELFSYTRKKIDRKSNDIVFFQDGEQLLPYKLSSGEKQMLVILLTVLVRNEEHCVLFMDEPEASLHIEWQQKLIGMIRDLNPNVQLILTTHSPAVIMEGWLDAVTEVEDISTVISV